MRRVTSGLLLFVVFIAGCFATQIVKEVVFPKLHAGQGNVQKWDYYCAKNEYYGAKAATDFAKKAGLEGWELVTIQKDVYCFKRPLN